MIDNVSNNINSNKYHLQDKQYKYPYHYIPSFDEDGYGICYRIWKKGFEYLCYTKHVVEIINELSPSSLLEIGCGDGRVIGMVQNIDVKTGVDLSERSISFAKAFHPTINFHSIDAKNLEETFDIVIAVEVLEHIPDEHVSDFFKSLSARTKTGQYVVVTVPTKVKRLIKKHYRHYDLASFKKELDNSETSLKIHKYSYIYRDSILMRIYRKIFLNRFWIFELHYIRKIMWKYCWNKLRFATEHDGEHLVVTLKK